MRWLARIVLGLGLILCSSSALWAQIGGSGGGLGIVIPRGDWDETLGPGAGLAAHYDLQAARGFAYTLGGGILVHWPATRGQMEYSGIEVPIHLGIKVGLVPPLYAVAVAETTLALTNQEDTITGTKDGSISVGLNGGVGGGITLGPVDLRALYYAGSYGSLSKTSSLMITLTYYQEPGSSNGGSESSTSRQRRHTKPDKSKKSTYQGRTADDFKCQYSDECKKHGRCTAHEGKCVKKTKRKYRRRTRDLFD